MGNAFYFEFEPHLMIWLQNMLGEKGALAISHLSALGEEAVAIVIIGFLYWCYDKQFGIYIATNVITGVVFNGFIKNIALRLRPYIVHKEIVCYRPQDKSADIYDVAAQGYSFPSAHSMNSTIIYGSLARYTKGRIFTILAFLLPFLIGISRIVVGVHYPSDVMFGWGVGAILVFLLPFIYEKAGEEKRTLVNFIIFVVFATGFFFCKTTDYYTGMGLMAGFFPAIEFEKRYVKFEGTKKPLSIVMRFAGGFLIYLVLNMLLKLPFSKEFLESYTMGAFVVRFLRYAIIIFVMFGVYPLAFKLVNKKKA
ncbi:phosphatase PAP2 family protein [Butyrivibrio sp. LC3010]|uniref:phosphatase PAP2 family protein n=1 Tax=Butyrivibrio sp. LC3010 TaxID=1280680 RepID=UPI0004085545|nr:phosphatase PAP2 family protein [Butyrivibrio sp. LC3010]